LWRTALEPDVWQRVRAEADDVLGPLDGTATRPDETSFARLTYADRVVRESLRLHPAGLIGARVAANDLTIGNRRIRKGTLIVWSPHLAGRDDTAWPDPLRFNPDRYLNLTPAQKVATDQAWVPFGRGPHMCIGYALAQMELTLILARLAQRLDLQPTSSIVPRPVGMVVNRPKGGAPFDVRARPAT
jgi:cytochrome P450